MFWNPTKSTWDNLQSWCWQFGPNASHFRNRQKKVCHSKNFLSITEHQAFDRTEKTTTWKHHRGLGEPRDTLGRLKLTTGRDQREWMASSRTFQLFSQPRSAFQNHTSAWDNSEVILQNVKASECTQGFLKQEASINTMNQTHFKSLLRKKKKKTERKKPEKQVKESHEKFTCR